MPRDAPVWDVLKRDDVELLRRMIANREVGVRYRTDLGLTLLKEALLYRAVSCCRYLLSGSGTTLSREALLEFEDIHDMQQLNKAIRLLDLYTGDKTTIHHDPEDFRDSKDRDGRKLLDLWALALEYDLGAGVSFSFEAGAKSRRLWRRYAEPGPIFSPYSYMMLMRDHGHGNAWLIDQTKFWVHLVLETYGNPNRTLESRGGIVPQEYAIDKVAEGLAPNCPNELWCEGGNTPLKTPRLLNMLIDAGADVSYTREVNGCLRSLTNLAVEKGIKGLWEEALKECGYDPIDVYTEDARRRLAAESSSVEVKGLPSTDGLRHRHTARREAGGT
ncbi:hypothetical protein GGR53DRAFT_525079 [Hypoxylon sp. FL1150]|nr:hypothetical protein GGR53DRAFT_525079 [Hypoxylon sp. FL1150]